MGVDIDSECTSLRGYNEGNNTSALREMRI